MRIGIWLVALPLMSMSSCCPRGTHKKVDTATINPQAGVKLELQASTKEKLQINSKSQILAQDIKHEDDSRLNDDRVLRDVLKQESRLR